MKFSPTDAMNTICAFPKIENYIFTLKEMPTYSLRKGALAYVKTA